MIAYIDQIAKDEGKPVTIRGWLHNRRSSGKIHFLSVRDGTGFIQAIVSKAAVGDEKFKQADDNFDVIETLYGVGYRFKEA